MPLIPSSGTLSHDSTASPLTTLLPDLSPSAIAALPYPPDLFPGARDIQTALGRMHVYEWGKEDGRKIMLLHGDATPAPLFKWLAAKLIQQGCRLIVFDLWGRGYSDTPMIPHKDCLYSLQLLFAASSSPLPWTVDSFSIVGFSLGGAIAMDFVVSFPHLVRSVALLAPVGLLEELPDVYENLRQAAKDDKPEDEIRRRVADAQGVNVAEDLPKRQAKVELRIDADAIVRWQYLNHQGHVASFANTVHLGPLQDQHETWVKACEILRNKNQGLDNPEKLLVVCGRGDGVVPAEHLRENLCALAGNENFDLEMVDGGHGFLLSAGESEAVFRLLERAWKL